MAVKSKIRESARNEDCQVRLWNVCNHNSETVVLAHLNGGGGGMKHSDIHGAYACSNCHAWLDGGYAKEGTRQERDLIHLEAMVRTQIILLKKGLISIK